MSTPRVPEGVEAVADGVYVSRSPLRMATPADIAWLKEAARQATRRRARVCFHRDENDAVHEMLIAVRGDSFIPVHCHPDKEESMLVVEGRGTAILFHRDGGIKDTIPLAPADRTGSKEGATTFFYRMPMGVFHTLRIETDWFVFHEVSSGPFRRGGTVIPDWCPADADDSVGIEWLDGLIERETKA